MNTKSKQYNLDIKLTTSIQKKVLNLLTTGYTMKINDVENESDNFLSEFFDAEEIKILYAKKHFFSIPQKYSLKNAPWMLFCDGKNLLVEMQVFWEKNDLSKLIATEISPAKIQAKNLALTSYTILSEAEYYDRIDSKEENEEDDDQ